MKEVLDSKSYEQDLSFEVKAFRVMMLSYVFFGLFEIFEFGVFLVPVPIVFIMVPILGAIYAFLSRNNWQAILLLLMPVLVLQQLWIAEYPDLVQGLILLTFGFWMFWGIRFLVSKQLKNIPAAKLLGITHLAIPLTLLPIDTNWLFLALLLPGVGSALFYAKNQENKSILADLRVVLLILFIELLSLLFLVSMWTVSLQSAI